MMTHPVVRTAAILIGLVLPAGHATAAETAAKSVKVAPTEGVLARVNGVALPRHAFDQALLETLAAGQADSPRLRESIRDRLIAEELFWQEAKQRHAERDTDVVQAVEAFRRQAAIRKYLRDTVQVPEPAEEQVRRHYDQTRAALGPREFKLRLIQTPDESVIREAQKALAGGADFGALARGLSRAPSAARGGEIDWVSFPLPLQAGRTNGVPLPVAEALSGLKPGQVSAPLRVNDSWVMVRLEGERETLVPAYAQAGPLIARELKERALERATLRLAAELLRKADIEAESVTPAPPAAAPSSSHAFAKP